MFLCIRAYILLKAKIDIKIFDLLKTLIKRLTVRHLKQKADIFTSDEFNMALQNFYDEANNKDVVNKIAILLAYYGLLRLEEVIGIQKKDVRLDITTDVEVDYPYGTKRSAEGFSFKVPGLFKPLFQLYMNQFPLEADPSSRFLKNWSKAKDGRGRLQNWGQNNLALQAKQIAVWLGKEG